jgi:hypothetical protein
MIIFKEGSRGEAVRSLQYFLTNFLPCAADGEFGPGTVRAVKAAQSVLGLSVDGIVGPKSVAKFIERGWVPSWSEQPAAVSSPYPNKPGFAALNQAQKIAKFGLPGSPTSEPVPGGPIVLDPEFAKKLVTLDLAEWFPQAREKDFGIRHVQMHVKTERQWRAFFAAIVDSGHGADIISCAGSWVPRYVRGSKSTFSSHAFANAIDFNAQQNWLGAQPAKRGEKGCLLDIIEIGKRFKIFSGIWFSRIDGMHFESTHTDSELGL